MKKFDFRLNRFLKVKVALELNQSLSIHRLEMKIRQCMEEDVRLKKSLVEAQGLLQRHQEEKINLQGVISMMAYIDVIDRRIVQKKEEINQFQAGLAVERKKLIDLMNERKGLETLKERLFLTHKKEIEKEFQQQLDDLPKKISTVTPERFETHEQN